MNIQGEFDLTTLEGLKAYRYKQIDSITQILIGQGFTFDGQVFSLSVAAQSNWTNIKSNKTTFSAMGAFPLQISTKNDNIYMLTEANVDSFWGAGFIAVKNAYTSGADIKKLIFDSTTIEQINTIIDNRI